MKKRKKMAVALIAAVIAATTLPPVCFAGGGAQGGQQQNLSEKKLKEMDQYADSLRAQGLNEQQVEERMKEKFSPSEVEQWKRARR